MTPNLVWATLQLSISVGVSLWAIQGPLWAYWIALLAVGVSFVAFAVAFQQYYLAG